MKKILVAFEASAYPSHLSAFAIKLATQTGALLHPVFVNKTNIYPVVGQPLSADYSFSAVPLIVDDTMLEDNTELIRSNARLFENECREAGVPCTIDGDTALFVENLIDHSAFADLIIADAAEIFLQEFFPNTHCPVFLIPEKARMPQRAVLCYDESFSSIYALKMYSYLFPEWSGLPSALISINPKGDNGNKYDDYLSDWLPQHFTSLQRITEQGNLQTELTGLIGKENPYAVVVMGAFGGNAISRLFHKSLANVVLEETIASVFIIHE